MKFPIKITITTAFALFTIVSVSTVALVNYIGNRAAILETAHHNISKATSDAERTIDQIVNHASVNVNVISRLPAHFFDWRNPETLLVTLETSLRNSPGIYGVFVGFPDGGFVQVINFVTPDGRYHKVKGIPDGVATAWRVVEPLPGGGGIEKWRYFDRSAKDVGSNTLELGPQAVYDPRTRDWYINSQKLQKETVSGLYIFQSLRQPGVTLSKPVQRMNGLSVGADLSLDDLARLMVRLSPGENGVVAIIDPQGNVVSHPEPEKIVRVNQKNDVVELVAAAKMDDLRIRLAMREHAATPDVQMSFSADGNDYISYYRKAASNSVTKWDIVSVAFVADYTENLVATTRRSLIIAGVVLFVSVFGVAIMAGWIARPVIRLKDLSRQISQLKISQTEQYETPFEEIDQLQKTMVQMKGALDTFLRFVPRDVVRELILSKQAATVGGSNRDITIMFTDIEDFTSMSERMTPEEVMSQVSEYLEGLSAGIQSNSGIIDKYIGDAIMAIWNAPIVDEEHADHACRAALSAQRISEDLNARFIENGQSPMRTRIGLHSGDALVGNIGSCDRMQYTCLGSNVNLASRMEGLNKFYGTQVLASDAVRRRTSSDYLFRRVDIVEAKGSSVPVTIYELMGERGEGAEFYVGPEIVKRASKYEQAFDFYLHRDFSDALFVLDQLAKEDADDPVVALLSRKCRDYLDSPPPPSWNGATVLDEK